MRREMALLAAGVFAAAFAARADELKLKDGSKIVGTIVGFEDNSFKVKTSYGFALVQKDQVVSIVMSEAPKTAGTAAEKAPEAAKPAKSEPANKPAPAANTAAETKPASADVAASKSAKTEKNAAPAAAASPATVSAPAPAAGKPTAPAPAAATASAAPPTTPAGNAPKKPAPVATPAGTAAATPPKPPAPEPVREAVSGTTYINDTYNFRMYKPPGWQMIDDARKILPGTITAMGPSDESTYLLIGLAPVGQSLTNDIDEAEQRLREVMSNFRITEQKQMSVSGVSSIAHRFRGSVDQHEWSGMVVFVPLGPHIYTIFGMTRAESDLVQIQEQVIQRTIASLQFGR